MRDEFHNDETLLTSHETTSFPLFDMSTKLMICNVTKLLGIRFVSRLVLSFPVRESMGMLTHFGHRWSKSITVDSKQIQSCSFSYANGWYCLRLFTLFFLYIHPQKEYIVLIIEILSSIPHSPVPIHPLISTINKLPKAGPTREVSPHKRELKCDTNISPRRLMPYLLHQMVHYHTNLRGGHSIQMIIKSNQATT